MESLIAGKYAIYIAPAYGLTALVFLGMVVGSLRHARRWKRLARGAGGA